MNNPIWKRYSSLPIAPQCSILLKVRRSWPIALLQRETFRCRPIGYNGRMILTAGKRKYSERNLSHYHFAQGRWTCGARAQNGTREDFLGTRHSPLSIIFIAFARPTSLYCEEYVYIYTHTYMTVYELPLLANNTAVKHFYTNRDRCEVFGCLSLGAPVWRWLGEYVTLDRTFYSIPFKHEAVAAQLLPNFLPYRIPGGGLY